MNISNDYSKIMVLGVAVLVCSAMASAVHAQDQANAETAVVEKVAPVESGVSAVAENDVQAAPAVAKDGVEAVAQEAAAEQKIPAAEQEVKPVVEEVKKPAAVEKKVQAETKKAAPVVPTPAPVKKVKAPSKPVQAVSLPEQASMQDELIKKWKEQSSADQLKALETLAGSWSYTMRLWRDPSGNPDVSTGTSEARLIDGGAFLEQTINGTSLGQPFTGRDVTGYDNARKKYVGFRFYDLGTGTVSSESGGYEADANLLEQTGTYTDPAQGSTSFRWVTRVISKDEYVFQSFVTDAEYGEYLGMDINFKRKMDKKSKL